ncbi:MAG TPA: spore germination protein [Desulfobacteria bacterium]|nr:spore germination protein [Desulfobacteria bacterium]
MFKFLQRNKEKQLMKNEIVPGLEESSSSCLGEQNKEYPLVETAPQDTQLTLRGTKTQFSDSIDYNLALLTQRLPTDDLVCEQFSVGSLVKKKIIITYLKSVANPGIVAEVRDRIKAVKAPTVLESSYIERNIEDSNFSPFPQIENTKKPDVTESALVQGRIAIIVEGSPSVLLAPATFFDLMDTPEDAYIRWPVAGTFFKVARCVMFIIAASLPGFYIALNSYNPEMIPTRLLYMIIASREETPFPVYFEAFLMMGVIEAVRMMMIRLPSQVGSTIAIVSGITMVIAGLYQNFIGGVVVIVVTLTMIASFGIPNYDLRSSIRIIQFFTMAMSSILGIFGYAVSFFYIVVHISTLKSFGIPFMSPLAPTEGSGWGHTILRTNTEEMPQDETYQPLFKKRFNQGD